MRGALVFFAAVFVTAGPAGAITAVPGPLMIADAWAPAPAKPGGDTGLYMTIANNGDVDDKLLDTRCSFAQLTDQVESGNEGSPATRVAKAIPIPGQRTTALTPTGYHIRLLQTIGTLVPGQVLGCALTFQINGERLVEVTIKPPGTTAFK